MQIHNPLLRRILRSFFNEKRITQNDFDYTNVLYVSADEYYDDQLDHNFERKKAGLKYTLCYWDNGRIEYAKLTTTNLNYNEVFLFLYTDKKVGTRLNGNYKKYRYTS